MINIIIKYLKQHNIKIGLIRKDRFYIQKDLAFEIYNTTNIRCYGVNPIEDIENGFPITTYFNDDLSNPNFFNNLDEFIMESPHVERT